MPRAFTKTEKELIRAKLIAEGKRLVNRLGIKRFSVDDVVNGVGISKGSFYSFFPSREDFILSVFESWEEEYRGSLLREVEEGQGTPQERIERFILGSFTILEREPGLAQIRLKEIELIVAALPPARLAAHQSNDSRTLESAFARWAGKGLIAAGLDQALQGLAPALFSIAIHKDDFPPGSFEPTVRLIAEALAMRIAGGSSGTVKDDSPQVAGGEG